MSFFVVIPARYAASRLPGKPLADIGGWPMIRHVYDRAQASGAIEVIIATDDERVREAGEGFGADVHMTASDLASGTERAARVMTDRRKSKEAVVVNVQADEPLLPPQLIRQVAENLTARPRAHVATLCDSLETGEELFDPNVVKVVTDKNGYALYFSRAPIPFARDAFARDPNTLPPGIPYYRHIGLYAYRVGFLATYAAAPSCAPENAESLEQLRVLHQGGRIHVDKAKTSPGPGVDTSADLARVRRLVEREHSTGSNPANE